MLAAVPERPQARTLSAAHARAIHKAKSLKRDGEDARSSETGTPCPQVARIFFASGRSDKNCRIKGASRVTKPLEKAESETQLARQELSNDPQPREVDT
jgi:hypothetical protein